MKLAMTALATSFITTATQASPQHLTVEIGGLNAQGMYPDQAAFCPHPTSKSQNVSPSVTWSPGPDGTQSYALVMTDPDVPKDFSQINKPGVVTPKHTPRITVHHWVLVDIPPTMTSLPEGIDSDRVVPHGKPIGKTDHGRRGANVFTTFLSTNKEMAGIYGGYDGPCPPINDERVHRYIIRVFALDIPTLGLNGAFDGPAAEKAMTGHVLAKGQASGTYTLFPDSPAINE